MTKDALRREARAIRRGIADRQEREQALENHLCQLEVFRRATHIFSYMPLGDELNVEAINSYILQCGKKLYLPRVTGEKMDFHRVTDLSTQLEEGAYHIRAPLAQLEVGLHFDLMLAPGLAFSPEGGRLGYGGGYYDRYLKDHRRTGKVLGICFGQQLQGDIPIEPWDMKMDDILTDSGLYMDEK